MRSIIFFSLCLVCGLEGWQAPRLYKRLQDKINYWWHYGRKKQKIQHPNLDQYSAESQKINNQYNTSSTLGKIPGGARVGGIDPRSYSWDPNIPSSMQYMGGWSSTY
jgi:hypothetical protein